MFSQTRNIVIFGSERGKMSCQTREVDEKKEKEEKKRSHPGLEEEKRSPRPEIL